MLAGATLRLLSLRIQMEGLPDDMRWGYGTEECSNLVSDTACNSLVRAVKRLPELQVGVVLFVAQSASRASCC